MSGDVTAKAQILKHSPAAEVLDAFVKPEREGQ